MSEPSKTITPDWTPTDAQIMEVEQIVGMGNGAWDMVPASKLMQAVVKVYRSADAEPTPRTQIEALPTIVRHVHDAVSQPARQFDVHYVRRDDVLAVLRAGAPASGLPNARELVWNCLTSDHLDDAPDAYRMGAHQAICAADLALHRAGYLTESAERTAYAERIFKSAGPASGEAKP